MMKINEVFSKCNLTVKWESLVVGIDYGILGIGEINDYISFYIDRDSSESNDIVYELLWDNSLEEKKKLLRQLCVGLTDEVILKEEKKYIFCLLSTVGFDLTDEMLFRKVEDIFFKFGSASFMTDLFTKSSNAFYYDKGEKRVHEVVKDFIIELKVQLQEGGELPPSA